MPQLTLVELQCITTEDSVGVDECRLEVFLDGALQPALKRDMNNGQRWALNQTYTYQTAAQVKLWDEDTPDEDDLLGTVNIGATAGAATGTFTGDGASYKLSYQVVATTATASADDAALAAFVASTTTGVWANIKKPDLIADMRTKLTTRVNRVRPCAARRRSCLRWCPVSRTAMSASAGSYTKRAPSRRAPNGPDLRPRYGPALSTPR